MVHAELAEHRLQLVVEPLLRAPRWSACSASVTLPSRSSVTRFSGRGRSSVESQKSTAWRAMSLERPLAARASSRAASRRGTSAACDLPTIWMLPSGILEVVAAEVEVVEPERLLEDRRVLLLRQRQHGLAVVEHVVAPDLVGAVGEAVRVLRRSPTRAAAWRVFAAPHDDDHDVRRDTLASSPSRSTTTLGHRRAGGVRLEPRRPRAFVSSVTFGCSSAGRTPSTSASDLACTRHGKPSQFVQRTHAL